MHRLPATAAWATCVLLLAALPVLPLAGAQPGASADAVLPGRVLRVIDGDTLEVRLQSGPIRVRLQGIDAPERDQPGGSESTAWLTARVHDRDVLLEPVSQDQYERLVAVVHLEGVNINAESIRAGQAWAYRRYLRRSERDWCTAEHEARRAQRGLWSNAAARAPWEHRATRGRGPFTDYSRSTARECRAQMR